jgi:NADP-dependent 3-hydroxy acid dehydrogenase YdfG
MNGSVSSVMPRPGAAPYTASKHGVLGLTRSLSLDGRRYDIACGQIDIGNAGTEMTERMQRGVLQADGSLRPEPVMDVAHVADAVFHMAALPLSANVQQMTVMATKMPYIGRG